MKNSCLLHGCKYITFCCVDTFIMISITVVSVIEVPYYMIGKTFVHPFCTVIFYNLIAIRQNYCKQLLKQTMQ